MNQRVNNFGLAFRTGLIFRNALTSDFKKTTSGPRGGMNVRPAGGKAELEEKLFEGFGGWQGVRRIVMSQRPRGMSEVLR